MEDPITLDMSKTYIYEGGEYILTGRTAEKNVEDIPSPRKRRSKRPIRVVEPDRDVMVEIKPAPRPASSVRLTGISIDTQWVKVKELFIIHDMLDDE